MGNVIGGILPLALGVAISPVPIIAVILMLFSQRAKRNSLLFLLGWVLGLVVSAAIVYVIADAANVSTSSGPSKAASIIRILLGLLLFFAAFRQWRKRPKPGKEPVMPKWMSSIDSFTAGRSLGLAALLSGVNPKNLALTFSASVAIAQSGLEAGSVILVFVIYILIASATVAAPVLVYLIMGDKAAKTLDTWKAWLTENNGTVMFVLFLVFGMVLLGKGISGL